MNAYKLADALDWVCKNHLIGIGDADFKTTANMLRQQADRIAELEKAFINQRVQAYAKSLTDGTKASAIAKVLNAEPVDIWTSCLDCGQRITNDSIHTCSPQIKELTDRIAELSKNVDELEEELLKATHPNSEPVAWFDGKYYVCPELGYEYTITEQHPKDLGWIPLYTTPQIKDLSDEEIRTIQDMCHLKNVGYNTFIMRFARAILKKASKK
jgi:hypothetical protein